MERFYVVLWDLQLVKCCFEVVHMGRWANVVVFVVDAEDVNCKWFCI